MILTLGNHGVQMALTRSFSRKLKSMSKNMHKLVKNIKQPRKIPDCWKFAAETPICKKMKRLVEKLPPCFSTNHR